MVGTMIPIVYGERLRGGAPLSGIAYAAGSLLGGLSIGFAIGGMGSVAFAQLSTSTRLQVAAAVTGVVGIVYGLTGASLLPVPKLQVRRQVPSWWYKRFSGPTTGLLYGFNLGLGVTTYIPVVSFYLLPVWVFFQGDALGAGLVMGVFGLGRFLPLMIIGIQHGADGDALGPRQAGSVRADCQVP